MTIAAIIQARMSSTRLPGKVLLPLGGRTVLSHVVQRVSACPLVDKVVVATTDLAIDDLIVDEARSLGVHWSRGSSEDVLSRYVKAAREHCAATVIRITSDCPLVDPHLLGDMAQRFITSRTSPTPADYLSNTLERTYPRGYDVEIFTADTLERAHKEAKLAHEREHVTPYIYLNSEKFIIENYKGKTDRSSIRLTLDTPEDFSLLSAIFTELDQAGAIFSDAAVQALLDQSPELLALNSHISQKPAEPKA